VSWQIRYSECAKENLRHLDNEREIREYLNRQIGASEHPKHVGSGYRDMWRYRTNGTIVVVKFLEKDSTIEVQTIYKEY